MDLQLSREYILLYWAGTANQHRQTSRLYRKMRIRAAQWEFSRANVERGLAPGYGCVPHADWLIRYSTTVLLYGAHVWYEADDDLWWLGKISALTATDTEHLVRFLDDPETTKLPLSLAHYATLKGGVQGSWCLQLRRGRLVAREILNDMNESRGADVASWRSGHHCAGVLDPVSPILDAGSSENIILACVLYSVFTGGFSR